MLIATILTEILFPINIKYFVVKILKSSIELKTLKLIAVIFLIIFLSNLMETKNLLKEMVVYLSKLNLPKKIQFIILPAFIGLLPMPGGALFSAPMVDKALSGENFLNEEKTFINFWFRHIWEYFFPLYPGVILVTELYSFPSYKLFEYHSIFTILMLILGYFIVLKGKNIKNNLTKNEKFFQNLLGLIYSISPVIIIFIFVFIFKLNVVVSIAISCIFSIFLYKTSLSQLLKISKKSIKFDMLIMILGIFYFKKSLEITGAINLLPKMISSNNIFTLTILLIFLPLISGLLTGITIAYVGISFPVLSSYFFLGNSLYMPNLVLAYISGFIGVLLSPVHLCLLLTNEYFDSNLMKVYKLLIKGGLPLFIFLIIYYFILKTFSIS